MNTAVQFRIALGLAMGIAAFSQPALSQRPPTGPPAGEDRSPTQPGGRTTQPGDRTTTPTDRRSPFPDLARPLFLSGRVVMEDGTPPPESVMIERVCNNVIRAEGYTDSKGRFSFQLGQNTAVLQDASMGSAGELGRGFPGSAGASERDTGKRSTGSERELVGCELRAVLPGFRSDLVNLSGRRLFDNPEVGTLVLHRLANVEGTTISATSLQAPKDARKAFDKGREALRKNKVADAQKELEKAVEIYPKYASAWFELGRIHEQQNQIDEARKCYAAALAADSKFVNPYLQLALLSARDKKWQEVVETTDRALQLNSIDFPQAYFYNSVANYNLGKLDAAEKSAREAQKIDPAHRLPKVDHILGVILADKQDYAGAAEQMRNYLKFAPEAQDAEGVKAQLAELEKLLGAQTKVTPEK